MAKVLFVDSDLERYKTLQELLPDHNLDIAFTGWEGLGGAMVYKPDVMILNLMAPVMDGIHVMRLLRSEPELANMAVVAFSDPHHPQAEELAATMDFNAVVCWPPDETQLNAIIDALPPPPPKPPRDSK